MTLHSQIIGKGSPFLILHGFLGMGDNWKTLGSQFAELGYQVHLLDLRNHGRSFHSEIFNYQAMAEDVVSYCKENNLNTILLLGHSLGGKVAMEIAVQNPQLILKLIIADISPKAYPQHHQDILKALAMLDFSKLKSRGEAEEVLSQYIKDEGTLLFLLKNLYRKKEGGFGLRMNLPVLTKEIDEVGKALSTSSKYIGDSIFIKGEKSGYITNTDEILIHHHFPKAKIETVSNAGHWLHAENPDEFYDIVKNFL